MTRLTVLLAVLSAGCSSSLSVEETIAATDYVNVLLSETSLQILLNNTIIGEEVVVGFSPGGPTDFEVTDSTVDQVIDRVANLVALAGLQLDAADLTDQVHTALETALEAGLASATFADEVPLFDTFLCEYSGAAEATIGRIDSFGFIVSAAHVDISPATGDLSIALDLTNVTFDAHFDGGVTVTAADPCPDVGDSFEHDTVMTADLLELVLDVSFSSGAPCPDACCEPELFADLTAESGQLTGLSVDLPVIELTLLSHDVDLDEHISDAEAEDALNDAIDGALPQPLGRPRVEIGVAQASAATFAPAPPDDRVSFVWEIDEDLDGLAACDVCPTDPTNDVDGDSVCGLSDNCVAVPNPGQENADQDSNGDACDVCPQDPADDQDRDGLCAPTDNCPTVANPTQSDNDKDRVGDACDSDDDNDKVPDSRDNCPQKKNTDQANADLDAYGDVCDNCRFVNSADLTDTDGDGLGNVCDDDIDNDGIVNTKDNCVYHANPDQQDLDGDKVGDLCEVIDFELIRLLADARFEGIAHTLHDEGVLDGPWGPWGKLDCVFDCQSLPDFDRAWEDAATDTKLWMDGKGWPNLTEADVIEIMNLDPALVGGEYTAADYLGERF